MSTPATLLSELLVDGWSSPSSCGQQVKQSQTGPNGIQMGLVPRPNGGLKWRVHVALIKD
eukprot:251901-Chlamydomonas_euryale.AAC.2